MGKYDDILAGLPAPVQTSAPSAAPSGSGKYDDILAGLPEIKQDYPTRRTLMRYVGRPLIEGGAMTVGGVAGTALAGGNPLGGVALAASMYPPAHEFANRLEEQLGIGGRKPPPGTIPEQLMNTADQFTTGLGIEAGGKALNMGVTKGIEKAVRGGVSTFLGPSEEAVAARMARPGAIKNAPSYLQQAERLPVMLKNMGKAINGLYEKASRSLRDSPDVNKGAVPLSYVQKMISQLQDDLRIGDATVGPADKAATEKLGSLISDINNIVKQPKMPEILGPSGVPLNLQPKEVYLPETTVHKLVQRIRKNIDFTDKSASSINSVLTDVSGQLDAGLKSGNKAYAQMIKPVANLTRLQNDAIDKFNLTKRTGEGLAPTDATISSLKALPTERRGVSQGLAKRLKVATGEDIVQTAKDRQLADQFIGGNAQGSRRTLGGATIGSAIGTGLGHLVGAPGVGGSIGTMVGGVAGMASDTSGREMGGKIIDSYLKMEPSLAKLPYELIVRIISSGVLGPPKEEAK